MTLALGGIGPFAPPAVGDLGCSFGRMLGRPRGGLATCGVRLSLAALREGFAVFAFVFALALAGRLPE